MNYNVLDLFCGCGGITKGFIDSGLNVIAGIDICEKAINNYCKNFNHKGICMDLTKYSPEQLNINIFNIDIICGGFPCQSFSIAGKRDPKDPRNLLYMEYIKYVEYFKPKIIMIENVIGILSMKNENNEKIIDIILEKLKNINYICEINKICCSDFEVPQNRTRIILIGIRNDYKSNEKICFFPKIIIENKDDRIPVKTILLEKELIDKKYFLSNNAIQGILNKKQKSKEKGHGFGAQFLNFDKPSYTIPSRYYKDGYDALVKYNDNEIRRLTILELKRIQTFPDDFIMEGSNKDVITQIGNAVPPLLAYHLGKHLIKLMNILTFTIQSK